MYCWKHKSASQGLGISKASPGIMHWRLFHSPLYKRINKIMSSTRFIFLKKLLPVVCLILAATSLIGEQNPSRERDWTPGSGLLFLNISDFIRTQDTEVLHASVSQKRGLSGVHLCLSECHAFLNCTRWRDL